MTPLHVPGIHAVSFNRNSIGIEILGEYDTEDPCSGRGLECMKIAAATAKVLFEWLDIPVNADTLKFHRDDPKTSKTCPGKKVKKDWFISLVQSSVNQIGVATQTLIPTTEVKLIEYVVQEKGYKHAVATKLLKTDKGITTFNGVWIESAHYDSTLQATMASADELATDVQQQS